MKSVRDLLGLTPPLEAAPLAAKWSALAEAATAAAAASLRLLVARPPASDVRAEIRAQAERCAAPRRAQLAADLERLPGALVEHDAQTASIVKHHDLLGCIGTPLTFETLCALDVDWVVERLSALVRPDDADTGEPMRERPRLFREHKRTEAEGVAAHARFVDETAAAGIALEHLEITESRRRIDTYQAERLAEQRAADARANAGPLRRSGR